MAMTLLKIKDNQVNLSIAGMPSALFIEARQRRSKKSRSARCLWEVSPNPIIKNSEFRSVDGDCVVVMSDGFPEMFNAENEMLGFEKAAEILAAIADHSPQEIINHLVKVGEDWANGRPQDDDVTFVVLKIGSDGN